MDESKWPSLHQGNWCSGGFPFPRLEIEGLPLPRTVSLREAQTKTCGW